MGGLRMTFATAMVLQGLAKGLRHGFDIADLTGIRGGTVYPILRRLERMGLVASEWEDVEISREEGRPTRRYYRLREEAGPLLLWFAAFSCLKTFSGHLLHRRRRMWNRCRPTCAMPRQSAISWPLTANRNPAMVVIARSIRSVSRWRISIPLACGATNIPSSAR